MNYKDMTLHLKRIEICDLLLACLAAKDMAGDNGKKWERLHEKIKKQLKELDEQFTIGL